ncbi:unnamed protein product [Euphydryas editha]|uniref:Uncharacterized protein n=1 Tax=Euphydryas editha TaxID=104508 RepID=A0AAU9V422_EUPED|nr:unnamed protein product [Euphydryas editha]
MLYARSEQLDFLTASPFNYFLLFIPVGTERIDGELGLCSFVDDGKKIDECISILEPITESIFNLEGVQFGIHKIYITFNDILAKIRFTLPHTSMLNEEGKQKILTSVAERSKMSIRPIHLAAYMLDPSAQDVELTQDEELQVMDKM